MPRTGKELSWLPGHTIPSVVVLSSEEESLNEETCKVNSPPPYPFSTAEQLLQHTREHRLSISQLMLEKRIRPEGQVRDPARVTGDLVSHEGVRPRRMPH